MNSRLIHSNNPIIQKALDAFSIARHKAFKEGSASAWVYERLFRQIFLEIAQGRLRRAVYLFRFRLGLFLSQGFKPDPYLDWIFSNEPSLYEHALQRTQASYLPQKPLISIVTPVFRPPAPVLAKMLGSVAAQTYANWEHCLVIADPNDAISRERLAQLAEKDPRVRVQNLESNMGISGNTNAAIAMAKGEWVAFLDHDDQLAPFALFEIAKAINDHPDAEVIYSDEDKIRQSDQYRFSPFFKPDFNPDTLNSLNYMAHFLAVRKSTGDVAGWLDSTFDGSQDYDLALKLTEQTANFVHVPKILYHWKIVEGSTAGSLENKPYATEAGARALQAHLKRCNQGGWVVPGSYPFQVHYPIPGQPLVTIIIPSHDHSDSLSRLLQSIFEKTTYPEFEIIIVENGSREAETFAYYQTLKSNPKIRVIEWKDPFNYSLVNNFGEQHATGDVILLLNNDVEVISPDWLERMLEHAMRPEIGAVGAKLYYPSDTIQHAGVIVGMFGLAGHSQKNYPRKSPGYYNRLISVQNYSAVTAACLMLRRQVFHEVNGLDPLFRLEFGDVDFCLRLMQRGYRNLWTPYAELYHHESQTRGGYDTREKKALNAHEVSIFQERWSDFLQKGDPSYNPNLTLAKEDFDFNMSD